MENQIVHKSTVGFWFYKMLFLGLLILVALSLGNTIIDILKCIERGENIAEIFTGIFFVILSLSLAILLLIVFLRIKKIGISDIGITLPLETVPWSQITKYKIYLGPFIFLSVNYIDNGLCNKIIGVFPFYNYKKLKR